MEIKKSELSLENFIVQACSFQTIPSDNKPTIKQLKNLPVELDFDILFNKNNSSRFKLLIEVSSNTDENPEPGYSFSIVSEAEYNIKGLSKMEDNKQQQYILYTALPLAISMIRSHLYQTSANFPHGHYLLPSIDLNDLFKKKFINNEQV